MGRPTKFTKKLGEDICLRIAEGESLRSICEDEKYPDKSTVLRWLLDERYVDFREQYEIARDLQCEGFEDECIDIADDGTNDWMERKVGKDETIEVVNHEHIQRSRVRIDTRKWAIERMQARRKRRDSGKTKPQKINLVTLPKLEKPIE